MHISLYGGGVSDTTFHQHADLNKTLTQIVKEQCWMSRSRCYMLV